MLAQMPPSPPAQHPSVKPQFFAGNVTELDNQHITVSRTLVGHSSESRTFAINSKTKMNKSVLKLRVRVTVRYRHFDSGDVALEIQLQPSARTPKT